MEKIRQFFQKFGKYLSEVNTEYKKISWPDRHELVDSTVVVITFIVLLAIVVAVFDKVILILLQAINA